MRLGVRSGTRTRFLTATGHDAARHAYLKVAEGCDHPCTFCIIPKLRGTFRSRSEESILARPGVRPSRNQRAGSDRAGHVDVGPGSRHAPRRFGDAARALCKIDRAIEWIRLLYLYPATVDSELIERDRRLPKVCKYMDMPLQHALPKSCVRCCDPPTANAIWKSSRVSRARSGNYDALDLYRGVSGRKRRARRIPRVWIERAELDRVGFFAYSREAGTPGAELPNQVPEDETGPAHSSARGATPRLGDCACRTHRRRG